MKKVISRPRVSALVGALVALSCGDDSQVIGKRTSSESGSGGSAATDTGGTSGAGRGGSTSGRGGAASGSGGAPQQGGDAGAGAIGGTGATPSAGTSGAAGSGASGLGGSGSGAGGIGGSAGAVPGAGTAGASGGGQAGAAGAAGAGGSCDNGCTRDSAPMGCASSESSWTCSGNHDMDLFLASCESQPIGSIRYCCPAGFLSQCPDCPGDGAACTFGRCCSGLSCCGGVPIPAGGEYCAAQCPQ